MPHATLPSHKHSERTIEQHNSGQQHQRQLNKVAALPGREQVLQADIAQGAHATPGLLTDHKGRYKIVSVLFLYARYKGIQQPEKGKMRFVVTIELSAGKAPAEAMETSSEASKTIAQYLLPHKCDPINLVDVSDEKLGHKGCASFMGVAECDSTTARTASSVPKSMRV